MGGTPTTLWALAGAPLPAGTVPDGAFVSIWMVVTAIFSYVLRALLHRNRPTWPEFRLVFIGSSLLTFWYLLTVIDRWIHYDQRFVQYGYILVPALFEGLRVGSGIILLWGTYTVVWKELENRFPEEQQGKWWFAAKFTIFIVGLVAFFYFVLNLALSIVWMQFRSLNTIADIATKRTGFEVAMTVFFFLFGLLTLSASTASIFWKAREQAGSVRQSRMVLWLATFVLFVRSTADLGIIVTATGPNGTRQSTMFARDVSYGLLSSLYLLLMCYTAWLVSNPADTGGQNVQLVEADLRGEILQKLRDKTKVGTSQPPAFSTILEDVRADLTGVLARGPLSSTLAISDDHKLAAADKYLRQLQNEFGRLDPKDPADYASRADTGSTFLRAFSRETARRSVGVRSILSNSDLRNGSRRPTPSSTRRVSGVPSVPSNPDLRAGSSRRVTPTGPPPGAASRHFTPPGGPGRYYSPPTGLPPMPEHLQQFPGVDVNRGMGVRPEHHRNSWEDVEY